MGKQYTGIDGSLHVAGSQVARVTDWSFDAAVETLETTSLGDFAKTYISGLQEASGSCSVFYYETDANKINAESLITDVMRTTARPNEAKVSMELRLAGGSKTRSLAFDAIITSVNIAAQVGDVIKADIEFAVSGALKTVTMAV